VSSPDPKIGRREWDTDCSTFLPTKRSLVEMLDFPSRLLALVEGAN
jgi:hypothetical protein